MKCIHCGHDANLKERQKTGARCEVCSKSFAFEPSTDSLTDRRFQRAIEYASAQGRLSFTHRQLWYALNRRDTSLKTAAKAVGKAAGAMAGLALIGMLITLNKLDDKGIPLWIAPAAWGGLLAVILLAVIFYVVFLYTLRVRPIGLPAERLPDLLRKWIKAHGPVEKLIGPVEKQAVPPVRQMEPDLTAYSFDRVLITDRDDTAAVLVANNFHFENSCAVMSLDGYPYGMAGTILSMLQRNPELTVFALHDASIEGCLLPLALRKRDWFPDPAMSLIDLGMRPRQVRRANHVIKPQTNGVPSDELNKLLTPREIEWLRKGYVTELASLRPGQVMKGTYRGMGIAREAPREAAERQAAGTDGPVFYYGHTYGYGGGSATAEADADAAAPDSFG